MHLIPAITVAFNANVLREATWQCYLLSLLRLVYVDITFIKTFGDLKLEMCCIVKEKLEIARTFAVAIKNNTTIVGHVPRLLSAICYLYIRKGGSIDCTGTGI